MEFLCKVHENGTKHFFESIDEERERVFFEQWDYRLCNDLKAYIDNSIECAKKAKVKKTTEGEVRGENQGEAQDIDASKATSNLSSPGAPDFTSHQSRHQSNWNTDGLYSVYTNYQVNSMKGLLTAFRNLSRHRKSLPPKVKAALNMFNSRGPSAGSSNDENFLRYFTSRFPSLPILIFHYAVIHKIAEIDFEKEFISFKSVPQEEGIDVAFSKPQTIKSITLQQDMFTL